MVDLIPHDVKDLIASFLSVRQVKRLVLVSRAWKAAGDKYRHTHLHVPSPRDLYQHDGAEEATSWAGLRQLLESQPARISWIKEMKVVTIYGAMKDTKAILRMVSPFITSWAEAYICDNCRDLLIDQYCKTAMLSHLSLALQPLPALEHLSVHFDGAWTMTLPGVLRMTPKLRSLCLRGYAVDVMAAGEAETWPKLVHLTTLSVDTCLRGLASDLLRTLLPLCKNIERFNLKLSPLEYDDEHALVAYLLPIVDSPTIGLQTVHFDIPWVGDEASDDATPDWFRRVFKDHDKSFFDRRAPTKHFSCTYPSIRLDITPWTLINLESFRVITTNNPRMSSGDSSDDEDDEDVYASSGVGYLPSRTTTGGLDSSLLHLMELVTSLTLFEAGYIANGLAFPPPEVIEGLQSLHVQTFIQGKRTLIHCWTGAQCSLFKFGRHDASYRLFPYKYRHWSEEPCLSNDGSVEHGYDFSPYNEPKNVDTTAPGPYEFTHYQADTSNGCDDEGWHLPLVLLDYVYSQTKHERMPSRGQIGLTLPPHVWQVLDDWYEGVQSLIVKSPKSKLHTPADGPNSAAQVLTME